MSPTKQTQKTAEDAATSRKTSKGFTDAEKAAMQERARELKAEARSKKKKADGESDVQAKIAEMAEPERSVAARLHVIIKESAPDLLPKTWYGMPAYADRNGKIVCFYQSSGKFDTRYATLGFNDTANLDDGDFWPVSYALKELTGDVEARIRTLVKQAVS